MNHSEPQKTPVFRPIPRQRRRLSSSIISAGAAAISLAVLIIAVWASAAASSITKASPEPPPVDTAQEPALAAPPTPAPLPSATPEAIATEVAPMLPSAPPSVDDRVEQLMNQLTTDEKIGQLLMLGFQGTTASQAASLINTYRPGSIVFYLNTESPQQTQTLTTGLQRLSTSTGAHIPLFIAVDHEGGRVQRLTKGVTYFPSKRVLGATYSPDLARLEGEVEGRELNSLGINMNLGPVLDVDSVPTNPIIGSFERSLGADANVVADLGAAYIDGLQSQQVVAVAKHFPGHGATTVDSHVTLPRLGYSLDDLNQRELVPFAAAIQRGVGALMTAHILFPAIDSQWPSSLSSAFIEGVIRQNLNYDGLVMTDDMGGMAAITGNYNAGDAAVQAILAGNDIAMVVGPAQRQAQAFSALKSAVARGTIPGDRLDRSVRRILTAKARVGVLDWNDVRVELPRPNRDALQQIADGAITLVRGGSQPVLIPTTAIRGLVVSAEALPRVGTASQLGVSIRQRRPETSELVFQMAGDNSDVLRQALARARTADFVVVGTSNAGPWQQNLVRQLVQSGVQPIVVGFGPPSEATGLPADVPYLAAYAPRSELAEAAAKVLFGEIPATGRLPISVGRYEAGWNAYQQIPAFARGGA